MNPIWELAERVVNLAIEKNLSFMDMHYSLELAEAILDKMELFSKEIAEEKNSEVAIGQS